MLGKACLSGFVVLLLCGCQQYPGRNLVASAVAKQEVTTAMAVTSRGGAPADISYLINARASSGSKKLVAHGYSRRYAQQRGLAAFWWNEGTMVCARVVTTHGRFSSIKAVSARDCGKGK